MHVVQYWTPHEHGAASGPTLSVQANAVVVVVGAGLVVVAVVVGVVVGSVHCPSAATPPRMTHLP